jgi:hypothetical protein
MYREEYVLVYGKVYWYCIKWGILCRRVCDSKGVKVCKRCKGICKKMLEKDFWERLWEI